MKKHIAENVNQIEATPVEEKYGHAIYSVVYDMKNKAMSVKPYDCPDIELGIDNFNGMNMVKI